MPLLQIPEETRSCCAHGHPSRHFDACCKHVDRQSWYRLYWLPWVGSLPHSLLMHVRCRCSQDDRHPALPATTGGRGAAGDGRDRRSVTAGRESLPLSAGLSGAAASGAGPHRSNARRITSSAAPGGISQSRETASIRRSIAAVARSVSPAGPGAGDASSDPATLAARFVARPAANAIPRATPTAPDATRRMRRSTRRGGRGASGSTFPGKPTDRDGSVAGDAPALGREGRGTAGTGTMTLAGDLPDELGGSVHGSGHSSSGRASRSRSTSAPSRPWRSKCRTMSRADSVMPRSQAMSVTPSSSARRRSSSTLKLSAMRPRISAASRVLRGASVSSSPTRRSLPHAPAQPNLVYAPNIVFRAEAPEGMWRPS